MSLLPYSFPLLISMMTFCTKISCVRSGGVAISPIKVVAAMECLSKQLEVHCSPTVADSRLHD